ncbi:MAG: histidinol-phosphate transaminase [Chloroflexi bacterium]|nr:histidinol-phosphate transaminase [Chloroflexota bacterium]
MASINRLFRSHLAHIKVYEPVDPVSELARKYGIDPENVLKLNGNENPFGPHPAVKAAIAEGELHLYPDPNQVKVRQALAEYTGAPFECVLAGAGGDELIDLLLRLFVEPGERLLDCEPTFGMYAFCARIANAEIVSVPRTADFEVDIEAVTREDNEHTKLLFLASPNNPTGNELSEADLLKLLALNMIIVVDETYYEFSGNTLAHLVPEHENLVILRSMSKWAGLAGVRVGYMIGSSTIVQHLMEIKQPYNVTAPAEAALLASLEHRGDLMENVNMIREQRGKLEEFLDGVESVKYFPSTANFILCEFSEGANEMYERLASKGVFVRKFSHPVLSHHLRLTVGRPEETTRLIEALAASV